MAILDVIQGVAAAVALDIPEAVYGVQDRTSVELRALANEMAERIAASRDWLALTRDFTITGDGVGETFALPNDFARFRLDAQLLSTASGLSLSRIDGPYGVLSAGFSPATALGQWGLRNGLFYANPVLSAGDAVAGVYITRDIVKGSDGALKERFTRDDDTFLLDERVLRLGMIWQWKENKGLPFDVAYQVYQDALGRAAAHEGTRGAIEMGGRRYFDRVKLAWPGIVGTPTNLPEPGAGTDYVAIYEAAKR